MDMDLIGSGVMSVFLGSSRESGDDAAGLADFLTQLSDILIDQGLDLRLIPWQWDGDNPPTLNYERTMLDSRLCIFLFLTHSTTGMRDRFEQAVDGYRRTHDHPRVVT